MTLVCFPLDHFDLSLKIMARTREDLALNINQVVRIKQLLLLIESIVRGIPMCTLIT